MSEDNHLLRAQAPITAAGWEEIDGEARERLTVALAGRLRSELNRVDELLEGLVSSKTKLRRVRSLLPGALRGIYTQAQLSSLTDAEEAKKGLTEALIAYLAP